MASTEAKGGDVPPKKTTWGDVITAGFEACKGYIDRGFDKAFDRIKALEARDAKLAERVAYLEGIAAGTEGKRFRVPAKGVKHD